MDKKYNISDKKLLCRAFQEQVSDLLIRHKSILDIMTKMEEYNSRISRSVAKSVTSCGCITIETKKQDYIGESYEEIANSTSSHLNGNLCENCKDVVDTEIGSYLFYLSALCNTLDLDLQDIMSKEYDKNFTLGIYSLR